MKRIKVHPDGIIAWLPDRLARNMRDAGEIIEMLDAEQLKDLRFVMYSFHNDSSGKEHLAMEFARAKAYSDHLQDNVLRGTIPQEMKGRMTRPLPPAYSWEKNPKSPDYLKIIPSKFHEHWRNVYRWKLAAKTNEEIATLLRDAGYADRKEYITKKKTTRVIHVKIDGKYVGRHIKNPLHCGLLVTGEDSKEPRRADLNELYPQEFSGEPFPIVVTLADFKKVNPELFSDTAKKGHQPRRRSKYPLGGKVLCKTLLERGERLCTMHGATPSGGSKKPSPRFHCSRCSPEHGINLPDLFAAVEEKLKDIKLTEKEHKLLVVTEWISYETERAAEEVTRRQIAVMKGDNTKAIAESRAMIRNMKYGTAPASTNEINAEEHRLKGLEVEQTSLLKREEELNEESMARYHDLDAFLELSKNGSIWWRKASDEKKLKMAELLILNVVVYGNNVASVSLAEPFAGWAKRSKGSDGGREKLFSKLRAIYFAIKDIPLSSLQMVTRLPQLSHP